jgi:hypothetical protein
MNMLSLNGLNRNSNVRVGYDNVAVLREGQLNIGKKFRLALSK